jgi:hypothetical protein
MKGRPREDRPPTQPRAGRLGTATVREATYDLLRAYGLNTIFGNLGSTEEPLLQDFPSDFRYILGLQEAAVVAAADGFSQAVRRPVMVNLHTGAGLGNAMGAPLTAYQNKTPLIITAGQQTREMLLLEHTPGVPGLELPDMDFVAIANVLEVPISREIGPPEGAEKFRHHLATSQVHAGCYEAALGTVHDTG